MSENETRQRLIDRDEVWKLFVEHYWDSFQKDRDLILCHVDAVLRMTPPIPASLSREAALREALAGVLNCIGNLEVDRLQMQQIRNARAVLDKSPAA